MTPKEVLVANQSSGRIHSLDDPWPETNSLQDSRDHVMRVINRYQRLTLAQAMAIDTALDAGLEVWAGYVTPYPGHGVMIESAGDAIEASLVKAGFELSLNVFRNRRRMFLPVA